MYCENCGTGLSGQETVCPYCGIALRPIIPAYNPFPPPAVNQTAMPGNMPQPTAQAVPAATVTTSQTEALAEAVAEMPAGNAADNTADNTADNAAETDGTNTTETAETVARDDAPLQQPQQPQRPLFPGERQPNNPQAGFCTRCGQKLQPGQTVCAFCGQSVTDAPTMPYVPYAQPYTYNPNRPTMSAYPPAYPPQTAYPPQFAGKKPKGIVLGIIALCLLLFTLVFVEFFPFLLFLFFLSLAFGIAAIVQGAQSHTAAGIVMGVITTILSGIFCLSIIAAFIEVFSNPEDYYEYYSYGKFFVQSLLSFFRR